MGNKLSTIKDANGANIKKRGYIALLFLSIQFGLQPFLNEWYMPHGICKSTVVLITECFKLLASIISLRYNNELSSEISKWNLYDSLLISFVPSAIYSVQQIFGMYAYQHLDPLIFNLMNQTKIIWSAIFLKLILNKTPTKKELISLNMLLVVAFMLSYETKKKDAQKDGKKNNNNKPHKKSTNGLLTVVLATICSGLAGTLSQRGLQNKKRNLFIFSAELAVYGIICTLVRLYFEAKVGVFDGQKINEYGFLYKLFDGGNLNVLIPILGTVIGGFGVGTVVKYTSVIHKSYALIMGIFLSLLIRRYAYEGELSRTLYIAVPMTMLSLYLKTRSAK
eukprot:176522_1